MKHHRTCHHRPLPRLVAKAMDLLLTAGIWKDVHAGEVDMRKLMAVAPRVQPANQAQEDASPPSTALALAPMAPVPTTLAPTELAMPRYSRVGLSTKEAVSLVTDMAINCIVSCPPAEWDEVALAIYFNERSLANCRGKDLSRFGVLPSLQVISTFTPPEALLQRMGKALVPSVARGFGVTRPQEWLYVRLQAALRGARNIGVNKVALRSIDEYDDIMDGWECKHRRRRG